MLGGGRVAQPVFKLASPRGGLVKGMLIAVSMLCGGVVAHADIRETKHNLADKSRLQGLGQDGASDEARLKIEREVCVFCHTPNLDQHANSAAIAPKWQPATRGDTSFEMFDDIGRTGTSEANPVGSVSMACLSCHDSTQALGIGEEHRADHPFGVPYRGPSVVESVAKRVRETLKREGALLPFRLAAMVHEDSDGFRPVQSAVVNDRQIWWASATGGARRSKNDLPLYPRQVEDVRIPFVECTSCHDPHTTREVFLRTNTEQSALCLTCHIK